MTGDEVERLVAQGEVTLVDVRSRAEYDGEAGYGCDPRQGHIPGAIHLPWQELADAASAGGDAVRRLIVERGGEPDRPLVAYCHSGQRSGVAVAAVRSAGVPAENYQGSWHEWSRRETG